MGNFVMTIPGPLFNGLPRRARPTDRSGVCRGTLYLAASAINEWVEPMSVVQAAYRKQAQAGKSKNNGSHERCIGLTWFLSTVEHCPPLQALTAAFPNDSGLSLLLSFHLPLFFLSLSLFVAHGAISKILSVVNSPDFQLEQQTNAK